MGTYSDEVKTRIGAKVKLQAIGNSKRKLRDVAVDLINASGLDWKTIAAGCYLSKATIGKLAKDETKNPQSETIERVFRFFDMQMSLSNEIIKGQYSNRPKEKK